MRKLIRISTFILLGSAINLSCGSSSKSKMPSTEIKPVKSNIEQKVKSYKKMDGLFPLYQDTTNGNTYMIVKKDQLGKDFIYFSYTADGVVAAGHFRGSFRDNRLFTIKKYFDRIEFVIKNTGFYFDPQNPISKSAEANISQAILVNQKIVAEDASKGEYLIDANSIFLTESLSQIKPSPNPGSRGFALGGLSKDKTKYISLKNYEKNTDVVVEYVYDNPAPMAGGGKEIADERAVSIFIQHSLIEAPVNNFKPRFDDPRIGYFSEQVEDMTTTNAVAYKDMIHRWHLVKKDSNAALSEPVEPIVWRIENTTPKEFRATIKEAGEKWNIAFESAGFKNAIVIKEQPDTADWDAGDIRYNVLRWTSSPQPPFGGYGPSFVDPRTGQILGADIMLEYIFVTNRIKQEQLFEAGKAMESFDKNGFMNYCDAGHHLHASTLFGASALQANGLSDIESREYIKQSLYYLVLHEMGHTLGLNHNMKASQMLKPSLLNNKELTRQIGLTASVMDYPAVNVALDKNKQGDYFTTRPGPYDLWAIQFGYSQGNGNEEEEKKRLLNLLSLSSDSLLIFGNDADDMRGIGSGIDPRVNVNDMSGDALTFASDRMFLANKIINGLKLRYTKEGESYHELRQAFNIAQNEYFYQLSVVSRYVGGVYV
ncbi:MAG: zinc-dependent metalloprotease, partial [Bacteroidia bacterium]